MRLPATTYNTLVEQINRLKLAAAVDGFTLKRLEREAGALRQQSPSEGWFVLGAVALLRKNVDEMRACLDRALQCAPNRAAMLMNYAVELREAGLFSEAADYNAAAYQADRSTEALEHAVAMALFTGRFSQAQRFLQQADQANIAVKPRYRDWLHDALEIIRIRGVQEDEIIAYFRNLEHVIQSSEDRRFIGRLISHYFHVLQEEDLAWLYNGVVLMTHDDADVEAVVALNDRLAEALARAAINPAVLEACVLEFVAVDPDAEAA